MPVWLHIVRRITINVHARLHKMINRCARPKLRLGWEMMAHTPLGILRLAGPGRWFSVRLHLKDRTKSCLAALPMVKVVVFATSTGTVISRQDLWWVQPPLRDCTATQFLGLIFELQPEMRSQYEKRTVRAIQIAAWSYWPCAAYNSAIGREQTKNSLRHHPQGYNNTSLVLMMRPTQHCNCDGLLLCVYLYCFVFSFRRWLPRLPSCIDIDASQVKSENCWTGLVFQSHSLLDSSSQSIAS